VSKPAGWTSFDVVAFVRRRSGERRVGHAGTLDPFAEGVLPVCLGQATRVVEYLMDAHKTYRAVVRLGRETDTYDRTGATIAESDASQVRREDFELALREFEGEIGQIPPPFSALKRDGVPLYKLARAGQPAVAPPRRVHVFRVEIISFEPPLAGIEVECGKGTYIRSLAHDLGHLLGVGGCLETLVRTRVGPFSIDRAVDVEALREEFDAGTWSERLVAIDEVLLEWPAAILGADNERRARTGVAAELAELRNAPGGRLRGYSCAGDFVAVMRREAPGRWRPEKVFQPA
jgi:tRNA pseudouridine55 synthase